MKTDGTPLHGSYFDLLNDKYPDLTHCLTQRCYPSVDVAPITESASSERCG